MKQNKVRVPLRERNRQRVVQRITTAAFKLFSASGYDQTTMDAIAEQAEVSRATLFNYFPTKDALLMPYAQELYLKHIQPQVLSYLDTQPTTLRALRFLLMSIHDQILTLPGMQRALQQEFARPHAHKGDANAGVGFLENITAILQHGQQRGDVRTDIPLEKLAHYVGVLCASLFIGLMETDMSTRYVADVDTLMTFLRTALHSSNDQLYTTNERQAAL